MKGLALRQSSLTTADLRSAYERYGPLVRRRCRTLLRDASLAEDACHNAFVKLMRYGDSFLEADSKLAWLYRTADNCCFDLLRSRQRRGAVPLEESPELAADDAGQARVEERRRCMVVLGALDEELQRIAVMHYVDELSQGQIGEALGWSRQSVNAKLALIRERCRKVEAE